MRQVKELAYGMAMQRSDMLFGYTVHATPVKVFCFVFEGTML